MNARDSADHDQPRLSDWGTTSQAAEFDTWQWLNDFADLSYLFGHEFNNFLNNLLLHISILELTSAGDKARQEAETIRRAGRELAAKVHRFQQLSREHRPPLEPVDLNQVVSTVATKAKPAGSVKLQVQLAADLPPVLGTFADLSHLVELLLQAAASALPSTAGQVTLRTESTGDCARLWVEDSGPPVLEAQMLQLFEPFVTVRPGGDGLKLAICRAVVRRLEGNIHAENRPGRGLAIVVQLRVASI